MDEIQILEKLIQELIDTKNKNNEMSKNVLDRVDNLLTMIVKRKFGKESDYLRQLETIRNSYKNPYFPSQTQHIFYEKNKMNLIKKGNKYVNLIETIFTELILNKTNDFPEERSLETEEANIKKRAIFVVHGRDEHIRNVIFEFLKAIQLDPIEWEEAIKMTGKTSPYIGEILETAFSNAQAILVVFTPDDLAKLNPRFHKEDDPPYEKELMGQARPNVLFEAGMGIGRNPNRTILIQIGNVKPFSDIAGRHIIKFKGTLEDRKILANRLESAGCAVNLEETDWLTKEDFTIIETKISDSGEEQITKDINESIEKKIQELFDEFTDIFIRLYKSKASTSNIFAQKIHNSLEMQEYLGITAKRPTKPGHSLDGEPIYFLYKLFKIVPNSAYLTYDYDRNGNFEYLMDKASAPDTIKDHLRRVFNMAIKFVKSEFKINIKFKGDI